MQENQEDGKRTDILHQEDEDMEETDIADTVQRPVIRKLLLYDMMGHIPADEDTGQETDDGQEYLTRDEVEPVEQRLAKDDQSIDGTQRQRTECTDDRR